MHHNVLLNLGSLQHQIQFSEGIFSIAKQWSLDKKGILVTKDFSVINLWVVDILL